MKFTLRQAHLLAQKYGVNLDVVPINVFKYGLNVELEHGTKFPMSNITNDDPDMTAKIVLAHLQEFPNYYQRLKQMEKKLEKENK
jgi:hypothetical protein